MAFRFMIKETLLRCSSWSCFLFMASSSSSSLDRLLPSDPTGAAHKPKKSYIKHKYTHPQRHTRTSFWRRPCFARTCIVRQDEMLQPQLRFGERQKNMAASFGCRAVRNTHSKWGIGGQKDTNVRQSWRDRQTEGLIGIFGYTDMTDVYASSFMSRFYWTLNTQNSTMQDRQDKSQFEVSLSYLCPSHLWHYCV